MSPPVHRDHYLLFQNSVKSFPCIYWFVWLSIVELYKDFNSYYILHRYPCVLWAVSKNSLVYSQLQIFSYTPFWWFKTFVLALWSLTYTELTAMVCILKAWGSFYFSYTGWNCSSPNSSKDCLFLIKEPWNFSILVFYLYEYMTCLCMYEMYGCGCDCWHTYALVSVLASSIFEKKNLFAAHHCLWAPRESFVSVPPLTTGALKLHIPATLPSFFEGSEDSNWGLHAYRVNALTTEKSSQSPARFFIAGF